MTAASLPNLQPLSLGELLDRAVRLYRNNFLTFVGIIAIMQVPIGIIQLAISLFSFSDVLAQSSAGGPPPGPAQIFTPAYFVGMGGTLLVGIISFVLIQGLATAAITRAVADTYLGEHISIVEAYRKTGPAWMRLITALILAGLLSILLLIWFIVPCVGWVSGLGILFFYSAVVAPLIVPAVVLEGRGGGGAVRRAWDLSRRRFWWVVGFVLILGLFAQLIVAGPAALVSFVLQVVFGNPLFADDPTAVFMVRTIIQSVVSLVFSLIYVPFQLINMTLLYFDLRVRTEGFDLALLADSQAHKMDVVAEAPRPGGGSVITMTEMGYFVLLSIVVGALFFMLWLVAAMLGLATMATSGVPLR